MPIVIALLVVVVLLFLMFIVTGGLIGSGKLLRVTKEWYSVTLRVIAATDETVTLPRKEETVCAGIFGISWQDASAIVGDIIASDEQTVTRRIVQTTQPLMAGLLVTWNIFVYQGNPEHALGLIYQDVDIPGQLGPLPAWFVPGRRETWAILVHGFHASREEGLRILPAFTQMGFPVLMLSYRNDAGAPVNPDLYYHLGDTEWQDVEVAVRYALSHGAQDVVLCGWSMGGFMVETFLRRSSYVNQVRAIVLDAPILNWHKAIDTQMHKLHFPHWFTYVVEWFATLRAGIQIAAFNYEQPAREQAIPTLLFHGTADGMVPIGSSDVFAQSRPDFVTYHRVSDADHTQAWNRDPEIYEDALKTFLTRVTERETHLIDTRAD